MSTDVQSFCKDAGIHNPVKITHFRLQCVHYGASRGLTEGQLSSVTKHITTCTTNHYMPEVDIETCKVMSGFLKHECRFVPSEHIVFDDNQKDYVQQCLGLMFPHYGQYVTEVESLPIKNSQYARKFVKEILPWLVEVALQCGCYFIHEFPHHAFSHLLHNMPMFFQ
jgi:hypothetical protein